MKRSNHIQFNRPGDPSKVVKFGNEGLTFSAKWKAESFLRELGYSFGSTSAMCPFVAVQKGEYTLPQKLYNFDKEDKAKVAGVIYSTDYREGEVEVWFFD